MIKNKDAYKQYLYQDKLALGITQKRPKLFGDEIWKYQRLLRKCEYYTNCKHGIIQRGYLLFLRLRLHNLGILLGFQIPLNCFDSGLSIAHTGCIIVHPNAKIGKNCRIHEMVNIGATNGSDKAPTIGDNCFLGTGAKIIGNIVITDDVALGANAVVVKSITESGTTWGGVPAKKISNNNSHSNLNRLLNL